MRVIGYIRLSSDTKGKGHSLDAQREAIAGWCKANRHDLVTIVAEVTSARTPHKLSGRRLAIAAIKAGMADTLVVRDLDRVSRSLIDGADLLHDAALNDWRLIGAVDGLDTDDAEREFERHLKIALAQEERRKIARRTKDGLAAAKRNGSQIGKPRQVTPAVERRIKALHKTGLTPYRIAKRLDEANVPTPQGGKVWSPSVVRDVIRRNPVKQGAA